MTSDKWVMILKDYLFSFTSENPPRIVFITDIFDEDYIRYFM